MVIQRDVYEEVRIMTTIMIMLFFESFHTIKKSASFGIFTTIKPK